MPLLHERHGHVAVLTLSRPNARNAWDEDYNEGLERHLSAFADDPDVRCVILTGDERGGAFSAGANLADARTHSVGSVGDYLAHIHHWRRFAANLLTDFPKPVIAAVNGYAIGIGCIASYCCDLVIASEHADWRMPQVRLGTMPAYGAAPRLARIVGKGNAMRASLGFPVDGAEAYRIGLAQWVVPHAELMPKAIEIADQVAAMPPLAVQSAKESMNKGLDIPNIRDASEADVYRFMALSMTEDAAEAHVAWREKRPAVVKGR